MLRSEEFDEKFLRYISEHTKGNFMVSPLSVRYALATLLAGAEGRAREELLNALKAESETEVREYLRSFSGFVSERNQMALERKKEIEEGIREGWLDPSDVDPVGRMFYIANSVWKNQKIPFSYGKAYLNELETEYFAEGKDLPENEAGKAVNDWVCDKTEGMISGVLPEDYHCDDLGLMLINTLYFASRWAVPFDKDATREDLFTTESGEKTRKMFMNQTEWYPYYADGSTQLVSMTLRGGVKAAFVLGDTSDLNGKLRKTSVRKVDVTIPRIELETTFGEGQIINYLKETGAQQIFDPWQKNFPKIADFPLFVGDIAQKTKLLLNEEGVKAAAATVNELVGGCVPDFEKPVIFRADRPFAFCLNIEFDDRIIQLFLGKIVK